MVSEFNLASEITKRKYLSGIHVIKNVDYVGEIPSDDTIFVIKCTIDKVIVDSIGGNISTNLRTITYTTSENRTQTPIKIEQAMDHSELVDGEIIYKFDDPNTTELSIKPIIVQIDKIGRAPNGEILYNFKLDTQIKILNIPNNPQ